MEGRLDFDMERQLDLGDEIEGVFGMERAGRSGGGGTLL
jgi:hypothetical protein